MALHAFSGNSGMLLLGVALLPLWWWHFRGTQAGVLGPPILSDPVLNAGVLIVLLVLSATVVVTAILGMSRGIVLSDGSRRISYECDQFRQQATTADDVRVVIAEFGNVLGDAVKEGDLVTLSSLRAVQKASDLRAMERVIVEYKCAHR